MNICFASSPRSISCSVCCLALASVAVLTFAALGGCKPAETEDAAGGAVVTTSWKLAEMPEAAMSVTEAKAAVSEGDAIVLQGRVGGRMDPITPDSGLFLLMDTVVPSCAASDDDHCPTPWDYCCETPASKVANAATVQIRDAEGEPIAFGGEDLSPLDVVTIVGTVAPRPNNETLVVHATGVFVVPAADAPE